MEAYRLNKSEQNEIIQSMFSSHKGIKLEFILLNIKFKNTISRKSQTSKS